MVPKCHRVADVGCDHGYLTIALLENKKADNAIAMDVNKGPLQSAKANVTSAGFAGQTDFRLSNGLEKLSPSEADVICICGMGGALIKRIIDAGMAVARTAKAIIIDKMDILHRCSELLLEKEKINRAEFEALFGAPDPDDESFDGVDIAD